MGNRFENITKTYKKPVLFLEKLEILNAKMEACLHKEEVFQKNSLIGKMKTSLKLDPANKMESLREEWIKLTGRLHPFIQDSDGRTSYLSSFLLETGLKTNIYHDFYHIPESQICSAYSYYESDCTLEHSWLVKRDAANKMETMIPENANIWIHRCHSGEYEIAQHGIALNLWEDGGIVNISRNLSHYGDMGHVMAAIHAGIDYKSSSTIFLCDIQDEEHVTLITEKDITGSRLQSCYVSPEHIFAVLSIENGKIVDACTKEEFLDRYYEKENEDSIRIPEDESFERLFQREDNEYLHDGSIYEQEEECER